MLIEAWVELPFCSTVVPGMPQNTSCVVLGMSWSSSPGPTTLTAARESTARSAPERVATTVSVSRAISSLAAPAGWALWAKAPGAPASSATDAAPVSSSPRR